jgi:uncharacterized protein YjiK
LAADVGQAETPSVVLINSRGEDIDKAGVREPSGICYHTSRGTLFVVGDEGDIYELTTDGALVKKKRIRKADFEGVTHDPSTGLLYVAVEGAESILEIHPDTFAVLRGFPIERTFKGKLLLKAGGQGIEAITFVPDEKHPHGGTFFVANQCFTLTETDDVSAIFEVEVPLKSGSTGSKATILRYFSLGVIDLAGLHYNAATGHIFVVSDATNTLFEIDKTGAILNAHALSGKDQEGITLLNNNQLFIAQDSGGIIRFPWHP